MVEVEPVNLVFLETDLIPDILEGQGGVDDDVLDAGHVEASPFLEALGDEGGDISFPEDLDDFLGGVLLLLGFGFGDAVFVDFLAEFAHGEFAVLDLSDEGGGDGGHSRVIY